MPGPTTRRKIYWICQLAGWGLYAILNALLLNAYMQLPLIANIGMLTYGLLGIAVTHLLRAYIRRSALLAKPWPQILARVAVMIPLGAISLTLLIFIDWWLWNGKSMANPKVSLSSLAASIVFNMSFLISLWLVIYIAVHIVWRSISLRDAQLSALQAQINPHFLFNSLNSLRALILENPAAAQDAVTRLSQLMRYSLTQSRRPTVPLGEEIEAVRDYLAIEKIRFEERLEIHWQIDPGLDSIEVPPMCLQTLVENALKHGIANLPAGGAIQIKAANSATGLTIEVTNPGSLTPTTANSTGTGLNNIRERLQLLRGPTAKFHLTEKNGQVAAIIELPTA